MILLSFAALGCEDDDSSIKEEEEQIVDVSFDTGSTESDMGQSDVAVIDEDMSTEEDLGSDSGTENPDDPKVYNPDWTEASHERLDEPNYDVAFPSDSVNTIEITLSAEKWASIRENMVELWGNDFGERQGGGGGDFADENPDYVEAHFSFNGKAWKNVGFRLKGNSTLSGSWSGGIYKLPFKLDFDEFEDSIPAIDNQRFYGFKKISFSPGYNDPSLIRDRLANDIFRMGGVPAAQTGFFAVYIDFGEGLKYCGLYTGLEVIDDKMVEAQFGEDDGNLYKPESTFASFSEDEFEKKSNEDEADFSDVQQFVSALNSNTRTSDASAWRSDLEQIFNMDHFLRYLAVNNIIVNWDSYGAMAHNFYLYNHSSDKLTWIPWDHNESLDGSPEITGGGNNRRSGVSLSMNEVSASAWPLLNYVAADAVYYAQYKTYLEEFNEGAFSQSAIDALIDKYYAMITPYVIGENGEQAGYTHLRNDAAFTSEKAVLKAHIADRKALVSSFTN